MTNYFVLSFDASEALPVGFAWFSELGRDVRGGSVWTFFATRSEAIAHANSHTRYTNPVLLAEDAT